MANEIYRIGIVGASSLVGKELSDELGESLLGASDFVLLDEDEAAGKITSTGDEAAFIQRLEPSSFDNMDFVFFAGSVEVTKRHWQSARRAGASIVDLTYALEGEKDVPVRAPWVAEALAAKSPRGGRELDLNTLAVVAGHPAAVMLGLVAARVQAKLPLKSVAATVMEPASEAGQPAMDELHQQTVSLLSFQNLPREQYDAQVAFNLLPAAGAAAKMRLAEGEGRILRHYQALSRGRLPELDLQLIHAPVFHGYSASVMLDLKGETTREQVVSALRGEHLEIAEESDPPTNVSAAGQEKVLTRVRPESDAPMTRFWLWLAADNLKLAARNAISCALELRRQRPQGKVQ